MSVTTPYQERTIAPPLVLPGDEPFWEAAAAGRLLVKRCADCARLHWYPRPLCPFCMSERTEWLQASGRGRILSYSISRKAGPVPYAIAYVALEEGVTMMSNIVDCDLDALSIGQALRLVFKATDGGPPLPMFTPA